MALSDLADVEPLLTPTLRFSLSIALPLGHDLLAGLVEIEIVREDIVGVIVGYEAYPAHLLERFAWSARAKISAEFVYERATQTAVREALG